MCFVPGSIAELRRERMAIEEARLEVKKEVGKTKRVKKAVGKKKGECD